MKRFYLAIAVVGLLAGCHRLEIDERSEEAIEDGASARDVAQMAGGADAASAGEDDVLMDASPEADGDRREDGGQSVDGTTLTKVSQFEEGRIAFKLDGKLFVRELPADESSKGPVVAFTDDGETWRPLSETPLADLIRNADRASYAETAGYRFLSRSCLSGSESAKQMLWWAPKGTSDFEAMEWPGGERFVRLLTIDGHLLAISHTKIWRFQPDRKSWTEVLPDDRVSYFGRQKVAVDGKRIYIAGGGRWYVVSEDLGETWRSIDAKDMVAKVQDWSVRPDGTIVTLGQDYAIPYERSVELSVHVRLPGQSWDSRPFLSPFELHSTGGGRLRVPNLTRCRGKIYLIGDGRRLGRLNFEKARIETVAEKGFGVGRFEAIAGSLAIERSPDGPVVLMAP